MESCSWCPWPYFSFVQHKLLFCSSSSWSYFRQIRFEFFRGFRFDRITLMVRFSGNDGGKLLYFVRFWFHVCKILLEVLFSLSFSSCSLILSLNFSPTLMLLMIPNYSHKDRLTQIWGSRSQMNNLRHSRTGCLEKWRRSRRISCFL